MVFKKDTYTCNGKKITVDGEWLNGLPHGICIVENHEVRGVFTFVHGKPIGPQWAETKEDGIRHSFEYATGDDDPPGFHRVYASDKSKNHVNSTTHQIPTPGWIQ